MRLSPLAAPLALLLLAACAAPQPSGPKVTLLTLNDVYRIEGVDGGEVGGIARLKSLRDRLAAGDPDLLVLHAGDLLFPSLLSRVYDGEQMIDALNRVDGDAVAFDERFFLVPGNHEFDKSDLDDASLLDARIEESQFTWLAANVDFAAGADGDPLVAADNLAPRALVEANGLTVGLFGVVTDVKHPDYVERFADPVETARAQTAALRAAGADLVIGLTHLTVAEDAALLEALGAEGPDLVVGGHEHSRQLVEAGGRYVVKADADLRSAALIEVWPAAGSAPEVRVTFLEPAGANPPPDPEVAAAVADWLARHDSEYCAESYGLPPGCLDEPLGRTDVKLVAEELEIRKYETNLGNWVLDRALAALRPEGADIAFLNAGSLRLNQDIPAGTLLTRRHLDELFAYPNELRLVELDGRTLQQVVERAVTDWQGNGWFLQIAGFAYSFDPVSGRVGDLTLLTGQGPRPIGPDDRILAVTNDFLTEPRYGQDGFVMLTPDRLRPIERAVPSLRDLVLQALMAGGPIAPVVEGRICNSQRPGPCLAVPAAGS